MMMLEYVKEKAKGNRQYRVTEAERRIFDTMKIITEANWVINSSTELRSIFGEIGVDQHLLSQ